MTTNTTRCAGCQSPVLHLQYLWLFLWYCSWNVFKYIYICIYLFPGSIMLSICLALERYITVCHPYFKLRRMQLQTSVCDKKREKAILQKQLINHLLKSRLLWIDKYVCRWSTKHYIVPVLLISVCYNFSRFYELSCVPYKCLFFWIVNKLNKMLHYKNSKFQLI